MRIVLLTPEYPGCGPSFGIGRYVESLATGLASRHQVLVLAAADGGFFLIEPGGMPRLHGRLPHHLALRWPLAAQLTAAVNRRFAAEVVEYSNWGGLGAGLSREQALVCRMSSPLQAGTLNPVKRVARGLLTWAEQRAVSRADVLIADSAAMAKRARSDYGRDGIVIHHGLELPPAPTTPGEGRHVLWLGRLEERKGIDLLIAAWPTVIRQIGHAELHVVGQDMGAWRKQLSTLPSVRVHGWLDGPAVAALRASCGTVVMPSRFESFGLAVLEAWSAGQCVVASDGGALPEVIAEAGWCPPAGDPSTLATSLIEALTNQAERERRHRLATLRLPLFNGAAFITASEKAYADAITVAHQRRLELA